MAARYNAADGSPDASFGVNGVAIAPGVGSNFVDAALEPDGRIVVAGSAGSNSFALARFLAAGPQIGSFTASPNPVTAGSSLTLTASNITDDIPSAAITQVAFYVQSNGVSTLLGYGTPSSAGVWTLSSANAFGLSAGTYTLFAQAEDNYGIFSDPFALTLTFQ
jgi:hypothetical protein